MNKLFKVLGLMFVLSMVGFVVAEDTTSRNASTLSGTSSVVLFDANRDFGWTVTAVEATSDLALTKATFSGRLVTTPQSKITQASTNGQLMIWLSSTTGISSNDLLYCKASASSPGVIAVAGTVTSTNVQCTTAPTVALAVGDIVYEVNTIATIPVGAASINRQGNGVVKTQGNSPLYVKVTSTATNDLSITAMKEAR